MKYIIFKWIYIIYITLIGSVVYGDYRLYLLTLEKNHLGDFIGIHIASFILILVFLACTTDCIYNLYQFLNKNIKLK